MTEASQEAPPPTRLPVGDESPAELCAALAEIGRAALPAGVTAGAPERVSDRRGVLVLRVGPLVVKAHREGTDEEVLARRLRLAADPALRGRVLAPLGPHRWVETSGPRPQRRIVTVWPYGDPVDPEDRPWTEGAALLAALHAVPVGAFSGPVPPWTGPTRVTRAINRMPAGHDPLAAAAVRAAYGTLPGWVRGEDGPPPPAAPLVIHGDWHLGQQIRVAPGRWLLIDPDDLGVGDAAWDLARPAALFSAGVLPAEDWGLFFTAYQAAGGRAVPPGVDPWAVLDIPARTLVVQMAATCVLLAQEEERPLGDPELALIDTCRRITANGIAR